MPTLYHVTRYACKMGVHAFWTFVVVGSVIAVILIAVGAAEWVHGD